MKRKIAVVIAVVLLALTAYMLYGYYAGGDEANGELALSGSIEAVETDLSALVAGRITSVKVQEGDAVKAGQLLVTLDPTLLNEQRIQARAGVDAAAADLRTARDDGDDQEIAAAEAKLKAAKATLSIADVQLGYARVTSPLPGVVLDLPANVGEYVSPGSTTVTIGDLRELELTVYVPEARLSQVSVGQKVSVSTDSYPGETFQATVRRIASQAEFTPTNTETKEQRVKLVFAVKLSLDDSGGKLKPGMPADAEFEAK